MNLLLFRCTLVIVYETKFSALTLEFEPQVSNWSPLQLNERVFIVELGGLLQQHSVLETEVFMSSDLSDAKLLFQPPTIQVQTLNFRIIRLYSSDQPSNSSFDLAWFVSSRGFYSKLDFQWKVEASYPRIISASAYMSVSFLSTSRIWR